MEWMNGRSLKSYKNTAKNQEINYKYNKDGIREEKNFNGEITKYYLENNHIIYEQRGNDTIYYLYDLTGLIGLRYQEENYYYIKNLQGDIIGILDKNYNRIVSYEYDSWGKLLSIKDEQENEITDETHIGIINPFRYRGYYYDTEIGLYYLNSRYYNPAWGRFINADSSLGMDNDHTEYNLYAYVSNSPINNSDLSGQFLKQAWNWVKGAVTGAINYVVDVIKAPFELMYNLVTNFHNTIDSIKRKTIVAVTNGDLNPQKNIENKIDRVVDATINGTPYQSGYSMGYEFVGPALVTTTPYVFDNAVKSSKIFGANNGYGFKLGDRAMILYRNPSFKEKYGMPGGTFINIKKKNGDRLIRIDWDPQDGYHIHKPTHRK